MLDAHGKRLRARLLDLFRRPINEPLGDDAFNALALEIFTYQFERNAPFSAFCRRRGADPQTVRHWTAIPAVPTAAFKEVALVTGRSEDAEVVFRTSGTTRGGERRGTHYLPDVSVYEAAVLPHFAAHLLPDNATLPMFALIPPAAELRDSSLAHMVQTVMERFSGEGSGHFMNARTGLDYAALQAAHARAERTDVAVCLLGTSFSFVHWTDHLRETGVTFRLPTGSRLMDTGGYKGRSREVPEDELRRTYRELLGMDTDFCVNEYGMTELSSQFYDSTLKHRSERGVAGQRRKLAPPWVRTRVVDAETLEPAPPGSVGLLQHCDLANFGSVLMVQTEDIGREVEDGFVVLGRAAGATPRGCSIAMDDLLEAVRARE